MKKYEKKKLPFLGVGTALVTPFSEGRLDLPAFRALLQRQLAGGVSALVVSGTTGEAATLTKSEKARLLAAAVEEVEHKVPILAGTGSNSTREAVTMARYAATHGADALLVVTPYYNKGTNEGIVSHYLSIAEAVDIPVVLYNVPSRTGVNIPLSSLSRLAEHENIVGIKEASGDMERVADILSACGDSLAVYSGNDSTYLPVLALGGVGLISVVSNILPAETVLLSNLFAEGKTKEAAILAGRLLPFIRLLFAEVNPSPIKYAMSLRGWIQKELRLPLTPPSASLCEKIEAELRKW